MNRTAKIQIVPANNEHTAPNGRGGVIHYKTRPTGEHFLRLRASNGAILAHSEMYSTRSNARRAAHAWLSAMLSVIESVEIRS